MTFFERNNPGEDEPTDDTSPEQGPDQGFDEDGDTVDLTPGNIDDEAITTSDDSNGGGGDTDQGFSEEPDRVEKGEDPDPEER